MPDPVATDKYTAEIVESLKTESEQTQAPDPVATAKYMAELVESLKTKSAPGSRELRRREA